MRQWTENSSQGCHIFYLDQFFAIMLLMCVIWGMSSACPDGNVLWISVTGGVALNYLAPVNGSAFRAASKEEFCYVLYPLWMRITG